MKLTTAATLVLALALVSTVLCQEPEHPGIALYKKGDDSAAAASLNAAVKSKEHKNNAEVWNYLGLAYLNMQQYKDSRKAFDKALKLAPSNSIYRSNLASVYLRTGDVRQAESEATKAIAADAKNLDALLIRGIAWIRLGKTDKAQADVDAILQLDPKYVEAYTLGADIQIQRLSFALAENAGVEGLKANLSFLAKAVEILTTVVQQCGDCPKKNLLIDRLNGAKALYDFAIKDQSVGPASPEPNVTPVKILVKPKASYTDAARSANIQGTVRLAILLGANGKILYVLPLKRLSHGLDEQAVYAARQIKFEPKMIDGKPVPVVVIFDYGFNIY